MTKFINILIGGEQKNQSIKTDGICTCLCSSMGMGGGYVPMIVLADKSKVESRKIISAVRLSVKWEWTYVSLKVA